MRKAIRTIAAVAMTASVIYAGYILVDSARSNKLNDDLSALHSQVSEETESTDTTLFQELEPDAEPKQDVETDTKPVLPKPIEIIAEKAPTADYDEETGMLKAMAAVYAQNQDTVGWIAVPGTKIDYPVVQTVDNDFYLHNDFNRKESQPGTIFADHRATVIDCFNHSDVITLYGHNQYDGSMFGLLDKYHNNLEFYKQNPVFFFSDLYYEYEYKIVSVFVCKTANSKLYPGETVFDYQNYVNFDDNYTREKFVENILSYSEIETTVDIQDDDKFMVLSTCAYDYKNARLVIVGRRVRENESSIVDVDNAVSKK